MQLIKYSIQCWQKRKRYDFVEMPSWMLAGLGSASFLVAGYWGMNLSSIVPEYLKVINKIGYIDALGTAIGVILLVQALHLWLFGVIAARCHTILVDRWFK